MTEPNACRHCGIPRREHAERWAEDVGWHKHVQPTDTQRLARMRERRNRKDTP